MSSRFFLIAIISLLGLAGCRSDLPRDVALAYRDLPEEIDFNFDVQPILSDRCYPCHGPDENTREAELRLDLEEAALAVLPETHNRAIVPDSTGKSELVARILHPDAEEQMPPADAKLALSAEEKAILIKWIEQGAEWKPHWAFVAPAQPEVPRISSDWIRDPIDAFVFAEMQRHQLKPSPEAGKETLLRRVTLDLTGLPPTLKDLDHFLADKSPDAYERVIDRLLSSPAYGERWAWDWLDIARYADTNGFQADPTRTMWPWRDWVVDAINSNMPFDQFTVEQLAGDLLPNATQSQIMATGFNRNHMYNGEGGRVPEETRVENVFDRVETLGTVWLGLTVNCSRCHDHKFDPLTQKEYYNLYDYFNQTSERGGIYGNGQVPPVLDLSPDDQEAKMTQLQKEVERIGEQLFEIELQLFPREKGESAAESPNAVNLRSREPLKQHPKNRIRFYLNRIAEDFEDTQPAYVGKLRELIEAKTVYEAQKEKNIRVMVMDQREEPRETFVLTRGTYNKPTDIAASMDVPAFLPALSDDAPKSRLGLARWLVSPEHPLTARVTVNRYWQAFFGTGFVKTVEDFGIQGEKPSHPRLLDWLAVEFSENGWDVKALMKRIVMSATYRQSSNLRPALQERDPENRLLSRGPRSRLPSWMIRDQSLALSGLLVDKMGGPSVRPYQPEGIWQEATFGFIKYEQDHGEKLYRKTLYTFWRRIVGPTMLFDNATRQTSSVKSPHTNSPMHALTTLNDITYVEAARMMAKRVMDLASDDAVRIETAFRIATSRYPTENEKDILLRRLEALRAQYQNAPEDAEKIIQVGEASPAVSSDTIEQAAYAGLCSLILNLDEVISKQ